MRIILDSNIIIRLPQILSLGGPETRFLIPQAVVHELSGIAERGLSGHWGNLIDKAIKANKARILVEPPLTSETIPRWKRLSIADAAILLSTLDYKKNHQGEKIYLVSDDVYLVREAAKLGIKYATSHTVLELLGTTQAPTENVELKKATDDIKKYNQLYLLQGFILGIGSSAIAWLSYYLRERLVAYFPIWGLLTFAVICGFALFWFRSRFRFSYGILEVCFSLTLILRQANPKYYDSLFLFQVLAGLYVLVRGLDNIEKGTAGTRLEPLWNRIFKGNINA